MTNRSLHRHSLEILEARIAPAVLPTDPAAFVKANFGGGIEVFEGQILSTTGTANTGAYLLYVEKGNAMVFFTDLNNNGTVEFNELTGIAAGDGLRMVSFVDIHGDIVTNLVEQKLNFPGQAPRVSLSLSDSDSNPSNDLEYNGSLGGDGRVVLNKTIEKIEMRSLRPDDLNDQNGDGTIDEIDVALRNPVTTHSIYGNIFAGKGFGATDGGLIIEASGLNNFGLERGTTITIGGIYTGTATSGKFFSFGASRLDDVAGTLATFIPGRGQAGGSIIGVKAVEQNGDIDTETRFSIKGLYAGNGGVGAPGGSIRDVTLNGDSSGGYEIIAGNGGNGPTGGAGGSITNFSDLGSVTSQVKIISGDGGIGSTGGGGAGGNFDFETYNIAGSVSIELGSGGDGFRNGGAGASLAAGTFDQPIYTDTTTANATGVTHVGDSSGDYVPVIGSHQVVDFDLDGFGDLVVTTQGAVHQVVVYFGNGAGGFRSVVGSDGIARVDKLTLEAPHNPEALVVADLNGDGIMDIATASADEGAQGVVFTYLGRFEDTNLDGVLSTDEDLDGDGRIDFLGFSGPIYSSLPLLERGDPATENALLPFWQGPMQISDLTAGDYDGDGDVELAVVATYYSRRTVNDETGKTTQLEYPTQVVVFMKGDRERSAITGQPELTGQFYADFGVKRQEKINPDGTLETIEAQPLTPFVSVRNAGSGSVSVETTALTNAEPGEGDAATYDVVILTAFGLGDLRTTEIPGLPDVSQVGVSIIEYSDQTAVPGGPSPAPDNSRVFQVGSVDQNRNPGPDNVAGVTVSVGATTVLDANGDGIADVGIFASSPVGFFVVSAGNNLPDETVAGDQANGGANGPIPEDNAGGYIGDYGITDITIQAIASGDVDGDGAMDDLIFLYQTGKAVIGIPFEEGPGTPDPDPEFGGGTRTVGTDPTGFTVMYATTDEPGVPLVVVNSLDQDETDHNRIIVLGETYSAYTIVDRALSISAGDGGDSAIASGGRGGFLGSGGDFQRVVDPVTGLVSQDFRGSLNLTLSGVVRLFAGDGGDGFVNGGIGGAVNGVSVRAKTTVTEILEVQSAAVAGSGGRGVTGTGGVGGDVRDSSLYGAVVVAAGDGGDGVIGGRGGAVLGNGTPAYDALVSGPSRVLVLSAGDGGNGTRKGGLGGVVSNYHTDINSPLGGDIQYLAGDGGNSVSGVGGMGGSIVNSSPGRNANIDGDIFLQAGNGGIGSVGGAGGNITNFVFSQRAEAIGVGLLTAIAGNGGNGTSGNGGKGGAISNLDVSTVGVPGFGVPAFTAHTFGRVLAGDGGDSAKANGGAGGSVTKTRVSASEGSMVIAAGAGGDALKVGGRGGDLTNIDMNFSGSTTNKGLLIAGDGGDGHAFADPADPRSFGGTIGQGGQGGSIVNVNQTGNSAAHSDFMAGDGGSTLNFAQILAKSKKSYAGKGGSIINVGASGAIGNTLDNVAIKSYNDELGGETMADYIDTKFRDPAAPGGTNLSDGDGNVGIVVGVAGRNKAVVVDSVGNPYVYEPLAPKNTPNGSLINVVSRDLMSAVAGSVDRIATIEVVRGLAVINGSIGTNKVPTTSVEYLKPDGSPTDTPAPVADGRLIDGAIFTHIYLDSLGRPLNEGGLVFIR